MSKIKSKKRLSIILLCVCLGVMGGYFGVREFMGADADQVKISEKDTIVSEYSDEEYDGANLLNIDSNSVKDILQCYENDKLDISVDDDYSMKYTVDNNMKGNVVNVEATVCIEKKYETDCGGSEKAALYLGSYDNCEYDKESGEVTSKYDFKGLIVNDEQPIATYFVSEDDKGTVYHTPVYLDDSDKATKLVVLVDNDGGVKVEGQLVEVDEEGKVLDEPKIEPLKNGVVIWPAYENFVVKQASIDETCVDASEVLNEDESYVYGTDFNLTFTDIPDGKYLYNYKIEYQNGEDKKEDVEGNKEEPEYCLYTDQQQVEVKEDEVVASKEINLEDFSIENYKTLGLRKFLYYVLKNKKNISEEDKKQVYERRVDGFEHPKGYISTWNSLDINRAMRTDTVDKLDADDQKTVEVLTKNCMNNQFDHDLLAIRNVSADFLTTIFGTKLNGEGLTDQMLREGGDKLCFELEEDLQKTIIGKKIHEKGFMSVSLIPNVNIMIARKVRLMIMVPKGTKAYVTHNVVESEAILPPNTNLVVKDVHYNRYRNRFDVHCVVEQNFE